MVRFNKNELKYRYFKMFSGRISRIVSLRWGMVRLGRRNAKLRSSLATQLEPNQSPSNVAGNHNHCHRTVSSLSQHYSFPRWIHTGRVTKSPVVPFDLPDVGEAIQTVEVKEWLVKEGDKVAMGDEVCEVQSDKSAVTIYVPFDGVIKQLMYEEGAVATKGKPLLMIEIEGEDVQTTPTQAPPPPVLDNISVAPSARKLANDNSVNLQLVKGTGKDGTIMKEDVLSFMEAVPKATEKAEVTVDTVQRSGKVLATPAVRHMAKEEGVNLSEVQGSGENGRILEEDLQRHIGLQKDVALPPTVPTRTVDVSQEDRTEPIKGFKSVMVRTMTASGQIPQFGYCDEVNMNQLVSLRSVIKDQLLEKGIKFSYMPIIIKAVSMALKEYPILNATVNPECTAITYKADQNIGVAMDTPEGLVVPIVKQVQERSVLDIAVELNRLQELGLKGALSPADISGGTFSLSNIGAVGGTYAKPMVLPPEVAIGAFGKVRVRPDFNTSGEVVPTHVMQASWSADHRVIDGATVARFSNRWKAFLEEPSIMILELR